MGAGPSSPGSLGSLGSLGSFSTFPSGSLGSSNSSDGKTCMPQIEPGHICPNGKVVNRDKTGNIRCEPLTCPPNTILKPDLKGTLGCTKTNNQGGPPVICPYGFKFDGAQCIPAITPFDWPATDNGNNCPVGYDPVVNPSGNGIVPICEISSVASGMGNIVNVCNVTTSAIPYNTPSAPLNTLLSSSTLPNGKCPGNSVPTLNKDCILGCSNVPGIVNVCLPGQSNVLDSNDNLVCLSPTSSPTSGPPTSGPLKFTNVYDFKSKERKVESFSNTNAKCKARY